MKKMKVILALVLAAALCLALFAACAKTETPAKTDEPAKTDTTPAKTNHADVDAVFHMPSYCVFRFSIYFD